MILEMQNINHELGHNKFFFNTTLDHSITGIFGPSGSGKTTFLNIIAGLEKPCSGKLILNDKILFDKVKKINTPPPKRGIGMVFQMHCLFPHLTARQNLNFGIKHTRGRKVYADFDTIVHLLGMENLLHKRPGELSGGERQRVAIGRALMIQPEMLLLDEPFSNLDNKKRKEISAYLLKINHHFGVPMLIISHEIEDLLRLTQQLAIIKNGYIRDNGNYFEILQREGITENKYLNMMDFQFTGQVTMDGLCVLTAPGALNHVLHVNSNLQNKGIKRGDKIRLCIRPEDISISNSFVEGISIQNQFMGRVKKIVEVEGTFFIKISSGVDYIVKITRAAIGKLDLCPGKSVNLLIKTKAIEVVGILGEKDTIRESIPQLPASVY
jgi:molybdate transport system ATP-binding protein